MGELCIVQFFCSSMGGGPGPGSRQGGVGRRLAKFKLRLCLRICLWRSTHLLLPPSHHPGLRSHTVVRTARSTDVYFIIKSNTPLASQLTTSSEEASSKSRRIYFRTSLIDHDHELCTIGLTWRKYPCIWLSPD
jgi:hypothetical protein